MSLYALILDSPDSQVWDNVQNSWPAPNHYIHDSRVAFVVDDKMLTSEVAETAGINKDTSGVVIQADYYSGYTSSVLVEWLGRFV